MYIQKNFPIEEILIQRNFPIVEEALRGYANIIGDEYLGYRNHIYRMIHFCFSLKSCSDEEKQKIMIAATFHDIGMWIANTVDYIPPSLPPVVEYLKEKSLESWIDEILLMITEHHKITPYSDRNSLVELFRKGDLVDFSGGLFKFGISDVYVALVKASFSNSDFHKNLARRELKWLLKNPLNPAPMMKW